LRTLPRLPEVLSARVEVLIKDRVAYFTYHARGRLISLEKKKKEKGREFIFQGGEGRAVSLVPPPVPWRRGKGWKNRTRPDVHVLFDGRGKRQEKRVKFSHSWNAPKENSGQNSFKEKEEISTGNGYRRAINLYEREKKGGSNHVSRRELPRGRPPSLATLLSRKFWLPLREGGGKRKKIGAAQPRWRRETSRRSSSGMGKWRGIKRAG